MWIRTYVAQSERESQAIVAVVLPEQIGRDLVWVKVRLATVLFVLSPVAVLTVFGAVKRPSAARAVWEGRLRELALRAADHTGSLEDGAAIHVVGYCLVSGAPHGIGNHARK